MRVIFAIPALTGTLHSECVLSLMQAQRILDLKGIPHELFILANCPLISTARNTLAAMFLQDPDATDLFFIDSDIGFDAAAILKLLERPEDVVGGIYPLKREEGGFPVVIKTEDGVPIGQGGLIEADFLPGGFLRIKRSVFERMVQAYPELKYEDSVVWVNSGTLQAAHDFFSMGVYGRRFRGEDFAFCQRWRDIGGRCWVYPDIDFEHVGQKAYKANYHEHLLRLPGGAKSELRLEKARKLEGWMTETELVWLAQQAAFRQKIVELGSFLGRSTRALADNTPGIVWAVDDWMGPRDFGEWEPEVSAGVFPGFMENMSDLIQSGKVLPVKRKHEHLDVSSLPIPDMVFLDGHHTYEATKREILRWQDRLLPGGLLCGHDANWATVDQAVKEALPGAQVAPGTQIWYATKG